MEVEERVIMKKDVIRNQRKTKERKGGYDKNALYNIIKPILYN